jgi:hypothetical protein
VNRDPADSVPGAPKVKGTVDVPRLDRAPVPGGEHDTVFSPQMHVSSQLPARAASWVRLAIRSLTTSM